MKLGRVESIHRYPVKSTGGESPASVEVALGGIPGDRGWAVRDEERGGIAGAKKWPVLMQFSSSLPNPEKPDAAAEITFPDGTRSSTDDPDINERLSEVLGQKVSLWPLQPADSLDHYRRGMPTHDDMETELRAIFGRTPDEALPDLSVFPPEIFEFSSPPGTYFDAFPLLILTRSSLATLQSRVPESRFDARRFRPNFLIDDTDPTEPFPEQAWCGRQLAIGEARVEVVMECPRCVMTTHGFDDLPKDPSVMRTLVREAGGNLGVYAKILNPGRVQTGDAVTQLPD